MEPAKHYLLSRQLSDNSKNLFNDLSQSPNLYTTDSTPKLLSSGGTPLFFKVILLGDCNVGKTSLIRRLIRNQFSHDRQATTQEDELIHYLLPLRSKPTSSTSLPQYDLSVSNLSSAVPTTIVGLEIWDTLGQERHSSLVSSYYKNASGIMIVYDVTSMESFLNVKSWLVELEQFFAIGGSGKSLDHQELAYILVGNKTDQEMQRVVKKERGKALAEKYGLAFIETSALNSHNCNKSFQILAQNIVSKAQANGFETIKKKEELSRRSIKLDDFSATIQFDKSDDDISSYIHECRVSFKNRFSDKMFNEKKSLPKGRTKKSRCC